MEALTKTNKDLRSSGSRFEPCASRILFGAAAARSSLLGLHFHIRLDAENVCGGNGALDVWKYHDEDSCSGGLSQSDWLGKV